MIFPIGDDNIEGGHKPLIAYGLIVVNVLIWLYQITLSVEDIEGFLYQYGIIPLEIVGGDDLYTLFTSMFLHAGLMHLAGNMLFLWIFADNIEAVVGSLYFAVFYLLGGLFATAVHIYLDPGSSIPTVGASGAISAVMGTYLIMFPKSRVKMIFFIFFRRPFYISSLLFLGFWFVQQLISGMGVIGAESAEEAGGVAWWAHIGGFVYGMILGVVFRNFFGDRYGYGEA